MQTKVVLVGGQEITLYSEDGRVWNSDPHGTTSAEDIPMPEVRWGLGSNAERAKRAQEASLATRRARRRRRETKNE